MYLCLAVEKRIIFEAFNQVLQLNIVLAVVFIGVLIFIVTVFIKIILIRPLNKTVAGLQNIAQ